MHTITFLRMNNDCYNLTNEYVATLMRIYDHLLYHCSIVDEEDISATQCVKFVVEATDEDIVVLNMRYPNYEEYITVERV